MNVLKKIFFFNFAILSFASFVNSSGLTQALELASLLSKNVTQPFASNFPTQKMQKLLEAKPNSHGVVELEVLQQGFQEGWPVGKLLGSNLSWESIKSVDGGNCGYHALKNVLFLMNVFEQNDEEYISKLLEKKPFFDCMSVWAPMIYERRGDNDRLGWLGGQEIDFLIKKLNKLLSIKAFNLLKFGAPIIVVEDVRNVGESVGLPVNEAMLQPIKKLAQRQYGVLGVVWTADRGGHWVGFVVYKQKGNQKIYYMNSAYGADPKFKQVVDLFSMSSQDIDKIVFQNQTQSMLQDLDRMQKTCDKLLGKNIKGERVFSNFIGCVQRKGSMFDNFTVGQLKQAGFNEDSFPALLDVVNKVWQDYLQKKVEAKDFEFREAYSNQMKIDKERVYGFWNNSKNDILFVSTLDVKDCVVAKNKYKKSMLLVDKDLETSFFNPQEAIHTNFNYILVAWRYNDQAAFKISLQKKLFDVLKNTLEYLNKYKGIYREINWKEFGEGNIRKFNSFKEVMNEVFKRLPDISDTEKKTFFVDYVNPLL